MKTGSGQRLRSFIKFVGITQKEFSDIIGTVQPRVTDLINERIHIQNYAEIIYKLGCNLNWIYTGEGTMFADNEAGRRLKEKANAEETLRKISETQIDYNSKKKNQPGLEAIPLNLSEEDILKIADRISENLMSRQAAAGKIPEN